MNSAWTKFWEDPAAYPNWEVNTVDELRAQLTTMR
jgi:hypothetical protein